MKRKYILMFMYVLTSICIFSIGFSSWTIVQNVNLTAQGDITAEDVISDDKYIYLNNKLGDNNSGIKSFEYYKTCFISYETDENGVVLPIKSENGELIIYYVIDLKTWQEDIDDNKQSTMSTKFTLGYSSIDANCEILSYLVGSPTITTSCSYEIKDFTNTNLSCSYILNIDLSSALTNYTGSEETRYVYLEIKYIFNHVEGNSFTNDIYEYIIKDDFAFILKSEVDLGE